MVFYHYLLIFSFFALSLANVDYRDIKTGNVIVDNKEFTYMDTVGMLVLKNGNWLSVFHVSSTGESMRDQHTVCRLSKDQGKTWGEIIDIEPVGLASGRASALLTSTGRIFVFYNYNFNNITQDLERNELKNFAFIGGEFYRYSDDDGKTWSDRHKIPMEVKALDKRNQFKGEELEGYGVGKAVQHNKDIFVQYSKRTNLPPNTTAVEIQDFLLYSPDLLDHPENATWYTLPEGPEGCTGNNTISAQEGNIVFYNNNDMYFLMRTDNGFVSVATSTDNGKSFTSNQFAYYYKVSKKPNKREVKSSRRLVNSDSPLSPYYMGNGKYLLPFYNAPFAKPFMGRNPLWLTAGVESDGTILWSQPELLLYSDYGVAFAYPDIFEHNGNYYITESNKAVARVHQISNSLINNLFNQKYSSERVAVTQEYLPPYSEFPSMNLPSLSKRESTTIELSLSIENTTASIPLIDCRGFKVEILKNAMYVTYANTTSKIVVRTEEVLTPGDLHDVSIVIDGLAMISYIYVDGIFMDGQNITGTNTWEFLTQLKDIDYDTKCTVNIEHVSLKSINFYDRALTTYDIIGNFRYSEKSSLPLAIILAVVFGGIIVIAIIVYVVYEFKSKHKKQILSDQEALLMNA